MSSSARGASGGDSLAGGGGGGGLVGESLSLGVTGVGGGEAATTVALVDPALSLLIQQFSSMIVQKVMIGDFEAEMIYIYIRTTLSNLFFSPVPGSGGVGVWQPAF